MKLFGREFVEKNSNIIKFIYQGHIYNLTQNFEIPDYYDIICKDITEISITLLDIDKITDISYMFSSSDFLLSDDMSKLDTKYITYMSNLFSNCSTLESLPDISNWNLSKVINISDIFEKCSSLKFLPDISKWDTSNIKYMRNIFKDCNSLVSLPDISKWNINNSTNICSMFQ